MSFSIDRVVPWGRNAAEYQAMFGLDESDLAGRVLGCGDGPASFNAEMSAEGRAVVSIDPLYAVSAAGIERQIGETFDEVMDQMRRHPEEFVWTDLRSVAELGRRRMAAMRRFLVDYPKGKAEGRYLEASLPDLCPSTTVPSTSRCPPTSSSSTAGSSIWTSTSAPWRRCRGWPWR